MTQAEKLEALVQKARELAWSKYDSWKVVQDPKGYLKLTQLPHNAAVEYAWDIEHILFNKDFARALFGEKRVWSEFRHATDSSVGTVRFQLTNAQYHLMQAVVSDDPIDYMYKAVFGDE